MALEEMVCVFPVRDPVMMKITIFAYIAVAQGKKNVFLAMAMGITFAMNVMGMVSSTAVVARGTANLAVVNVTVKVK
jgi:hypothetical protein